MSTIRELTDRRRRAGVEDIREVIADVNPVLRLCGRGNDFRGRNAADKFIQIDRHVGWRLKRLLIKRKGGHLRPGQADRWTEAWLVGLGLHRLRARSAIQRSHKPC